MNPTPLTLCGHCSHPEHVHLQPANEGDSWGPFYCEIPGCNCVMDDDPERRARILAAPNHARKRVENGTKYLETPPA